MKLLERVLLVQFFLFEKQEFELGKFVGIFGANGSGKSSLMDAIQIAINGADSNRVRFNAQAGEGKVSDRTINTYCLGRLGEEEYARDEALTYITLVWRDEQSGEATSAGVCLRASRDREKHEVQGRYVLPGIALTLADHVTLVNGDEMPAPFAEFRHRIEKEASRLGLQEALFDSATRYVQAMLYALRPASAVIQPDAFQKALSLGLNMRFDKSVDRIVREDMLVAKPTKIENFREMVHTLGKLRQLIKNIETKIEDGNDVERSFAALDKLEQQRIAYNKLLADVDKQLADETLGTAQNVESNLRSELNTKNSDLVATSKACAQADSNWQTATERLNKDVTRQQRILLEGKFEQQRDQAGTLRNAYLSGLNAIQNRLDSLRAEFGTELGDQIDLADLAMNPVLAHPLDTAADLLEHAVETAQKVLAEGYRLTSDRGGQIANRLHKIAEEQAAIERGLERVRQGKRPLNQSADSLRIALADEGINAIPICDLIQIADPEWQPAIESYLGSNIDALLVEGDPATEQAAFRTTRNQKGLYGTKIVLASRQSPPKTPNADWVSAMITGQHQAARWFIQGLLGELVQADSEADALSKPRALTRDFMLKSHGVFERLRPLSAHQLRIGYADVMTEKQRLDAAYEALKAEKLSVETQQYTLDKLLGVIAPIATSTTLLDDVAMSLSKVVLADNALAETRANLEKLSNAEEETLKIAVEYAFDLLEQYREKEKDLISAIGGLERDLNHAVNATAVAVQHVTACSTTAKALTDHGGYALEWAATEWDQMLERFHRDFSAMRDHCSQRSRHLTLAVDGKRNTANNAFHAFVTKHGENVSADAVDWRAQRTWLNETIVKLRDSQLTQYRDRMDEAYDTAQKTFRTDVAMVLRNNIKELDHRINRLNAVLRTCPTFSNGERYQFKRALRPAHKPLYDFLERIEQFGPGQDLLGGAGDIPEAFHALIDQASDTTGKSGPLDDYREFYDFDIEIFREDPETKARSRIGLLSKRAGSGSGGEHRAPLYVIAGAAMASAAHLETSGRDGLGLLLLDEVFDKMDLVNTVATMRYFNDLGLQVIMAGPGDKLGILNAFMHRYYTIDRDILHIEAHGHSQTEEMRRDFRADLLAFDEDDELLQAEIKRLTATEVIA